jgi:serine/threonine protein phosphatase 1
LAKQIDPSHILFLQRLPTSFQTRTHFFAHAGARPGISLDEQRSEDLLWIRDGFADSDHPFEKIVVHGHTPVEKPYFGKYRVNLDTQAYFTNRVSCLVLENGSTRMLDTAVVGGAANRT